MCVIICKNKGVSMPTEHELRQAFECNPHGIGFVSSNGIYWRGMDFEEFYKALQGVGIEDACIIHFRYATHGSHKVSNCHPFKMGDIYFAHNGVLPVRTQKDMTDSETVFQNILYPAAKMFGFATPDFNRVVNNNLWSSKFAFMKDGRIKIYGRWIREDNGLLWSNLNHRPISNWSIENGYYRPAGYRAIFA